MTAEFRPRRKRPGACDRRGAALVAAAVILSGPGAIPGAAPATQRVIIRLADGQARLSLLAAVRDPAVPLEIRHERVVEGLRAIHSTSYTLARPVLEEARSRGALVELGRLWIVNAVVAEVDPDWIDRLEADPAVAAVLPDRKIVLGADDAAGRTSGDPESAAAQPEPELVRIRVPEVWAQGITGLGAVVANVDTGVNGDDDTFGERWRGRVAGSDGTWFAPVTLSVFPEDDLSIGQGHGTATIGIMTGGEGSYGVAFDATWMAADVFEEGEGYVSNVIRAFQWLSDPDGDPSTRSDVPDVVNNSYGLTIVDEEGKLPCDRIFDDAIDALEASGAIVVWSAGNQGAQGITSPGSRADSPVNAFAVGSVNESDQVSVSSGRGPSACGGPNATKPEVVAPGESVRTRSLFNQFTSVSGTSFSTPMVAGVLALMRSKNPMLTPETAKTILLDTARDLGSPGDDNATGRGLVDAAAAIARVERPGQPLARLVGFRSGGQASGKLGPAAIEDALILRPGEIRALTPVLTNHGPAIPTTTATLSSPTPGVTVTGSSVALAAADPGELIDPGSGSFEVRLSEGIEPGADVVLDLAVQGAPIGPFRLILEAGDPMPREFATHDEGQVRLTVTNFGGLGFYTGLHESGFRLLGEGFRFPPQSPSWLFHGSFMAGVAADRLSDDIPYGEDTQNATDWFPVPGAELVEDRAFGGQRIVAQYDDRHALRPLGLQVRQESFAFGDDGADGFVILQYVLTNTASQTLAGVRVGLFTDWDLPGGGGGPAETAGWDPGRRLGLVEGGAGQPALGVVWLDDVPVAQLAYAAVTRDEIVESTVGNAATARGVEGARAPDLFGGEFSDAEKWDLLSSGQVRTDVDQPADVFQLIGRGPLTLGGGATDTVAVALVAAADRAALQLVAENAREVYFTRILEREPPGPPPTSDDVELAQNFPNPFRIGGVTTIPFSVPATGDGTIRVRLVVYDLLGRPVRRLLDREVVPGEQAVTWDGRSDAGSAVAAGLYVARLSADGTERSIRILALP